MSLHRMTKRIRRGDGISPVTIKEPDLYIHPRHIRDRSCECGYPRNPCRIDEKFTEPNRYTGNYCYVEDTPKIY